MEPVPCQHTAAHSYFLTKISFLLWGRYISHQRNRQGNVTVLCDLLLNRDKNIKKTSLLILGDYNVCTKGIIASYIF